MFLQSLWDQAEVPISVTVLTPRLIERLNLRSDGSNNFSTARFAIPELCRRFGWSGWVWWMDGADMAMRCDIAELARLGDGPEAVKVVKHDYKTSSPRKYVGTTLEAENQDYDRKNWSSLIAWNLTHWAHFRARDKLLTNDGKFLHRFGWLRDDEIGSLPAAFNHLVGEQPYNPEAKIAHHTLGLPGFEHYRHADYATEWTETLKRAARGLQYLGR